MVQYHFLSFFLQYKASEGGRWHTQEQKLSERGSNFDLPSITLTELLPDTTYSVRIAIYKDYDSRSLGTSTEIIQVHTDCEFLGSKYSSMKNQ